MDSTIDIEPRLIDFEESVVFDEAHLAKLEQLRWADALETTRTKDPGRMTEEAARFFSPSTDAEYQVIFSHWKAVGAVCLTGREIEPNLLSLLDWDGDTVYGGSQNLDAIFVFDVTRDNPQAPVYEALHWRLDF